MRKFKIETDADYRAYLHGRILFAAERLSAEHHMEAEKTLTLHQTVSFLEGYLEKLLEVEYSF